MKKIKSIALLLVFALLVSCFGFYSPKAFAADTGIKVQFFNSNRDPNSNTIAQCYKVFNTSSSPLDLSTVKLRYYYTQEGNQDQSFWCDYSGMMSGYSFINLTDKVTYKIVKMDKPVNGADSYIEIGFKNDAGSLEAGGNVVIQARTAKTDWSSYNQADDYSFNANSTDYSDWDKVTGYVNGTLGSGVEPDGSIPTPTQKDSTVSPTSAIFDKNVDKQADIPVTMTLNGNTLVSIVNGDYTLVKDKDYTVADNVVTLSKSYLATLEKDKSYGLVFNFSAGKTATFTLNVKDSTDTPVTETTLSVGTASGKPGEKVVVPVTVANVPKDGLGACQFNVNYDPSLLEVTDVKAGSNVSNPDLNFAYKDFSDSKYLKVVIANLSLKAGTNAVSGDGDIMYITFTIKANAAAGTTPVTLSNAKLIETNETVLNTKTSDGSVTITGTSIQKDSTVAPTSGTFDKNVDKQADIPVTMTLNGNTLVSIVNGDYTLVKDKDYTVADNVVTLSKSYLATLEKDKSYNLVFNFSAGKAATFTLNVKDSTVTPVTETTLSVGTASGKAGEKVVVPVTVANVPKDGLGACQFNVNYDPSLLEVTDVKAGSNVSNPDLNFAYKDFSDSKYIKIVIANLSLKAGTNAVSGDGDIMYITFTIKANAAAGTTPVTLSNAKLIETNETVLNTKTSDGSVTITGTSIQKDSTVAPTSGTFDKNVDKQADIPVTMTLNGNTLVSIVNGDYTLVKDKDYTVADNVVTLSKSYLATLEKGKSYGLVFNFSAGKAATFTLNVKDSTVTPVPGTTLSVGTLSGKPGDKVTVPVNMSGLSSALGACQFNVNYDPSVLEVTDVKAGSNVSNPDLNFAYKDFSNSKYVKFIIANLSLKAGTNAISGDGDVAYITFTIKANAAAGKTSLTLSNAKLIDLDEKVVTTTNANGSIAVVTE